MGVTIEQLQDFYTQRNELWSFSGLEVWLSKKGIEPDIIDVTIKQTLLDFEPDTLPETNAIFDNVVLLRALVTKEKLRHERHAKLQVEVKEASQWRELPKWKKLWLVLIGKV